MRALIPDGSAEGSYFSQLKIIVLEYQVLLESARKGLLFFFFSHLHILHSGLGYFRPHSVHYSVEEMCRFQPSVLLTAAHWCIFHWIDGVLRAGEMDAYDISYTIAFEVLVQKALQEKEGGKGKKDPNVIHKKNLGLSESPVASLPILLINN